MTPRPEGYEVTKKARAAIAAARRGKSWDESVKNKIGRGVRKGSQNKVPFNTRLDPVVIRNFRAKVKRSGKTMSSTIEALMRNY